MLKDMKSMISIATTLLCLGGLVATAAPIPATSSSSLIKNEMKIFSAKGFMIKTEGTNWQVIPQKGEDLFRFQPANSETASLSIRSDELKKSLSLEAYAKRWVKDYPQFGFDILGSRPFEQNGTRGLVIDLLHKKKNRQLRQVIYSRDQVAVIFTCTDNTDKFLQSLQSCNQIIQSFRWK